MTGITFSWRYAFPSALYHSVEAWPWQCWIHIRRPYYSDRHSVFLPFWTTGGSEWGMACVPVPLFDLCCLPCVQSSLYSTPHILCPVITCDPWWWPDRWCPLPSRPFAFGGELGGGVRLELLPALLNMLPFILLLGIWKILQAEAEQGQIVLWRYWRLGGRPVSGICLVFPILLCLFVGRKKRYLWEARKNTLWLQDLTTLWPLVSPSPAPGNLRKVVKQ